MFDLRLEASDPGFELGGFRLAHLYCFSENRFPPAQDLNILPLLLKPGNLPPLGLDIADQQILRFAKIFPCLSG